MLNDTPSHPVVRLITYRDPATLVALDRPAFGDRSRLIIELTRRSRLRDAHLSIPLSHGSTTTVSPRRAWRRVRRRITRSDRGPKPDVLLVVCHLDDLDGLLPQISHVDDVRLLWHPSDVPSPAVETTLRRLEHAALGAAVGPRPVYFCGAGRPATADDWLRAVRCPVLGMLADTARRRRMRDSVDPGPMAPMQPAAAPSRGRPALRLVWSDGG